VPGLAHASLDTGQRGRYGAPRLLAALEAGACPGIQTLGLRGLLDNKKDGGGCRAGPSHGTRGVAQLECLYLGSR
jgi:hypothetical protein